MKQGNKYLLRSLSFPYNNYQPNEYSSWIFQADTNKIVLVEVSYLSLDLLGNDTLTFRDACSHDQHNGTLILRTSWGRKLRTLTSSGRCLALVFHTDDAREDAGFELLISQLDSSSRRK